MPSMPKNLISIIVKKRSRIEANKYEIKVFHKSCARKKHRRKKLKYMKVIEQKRERR
jgi:hypothetical protein